MATNNNTTTNSKKPELSPIIESADKLKMRAARFAIPTNATTSGDAAASSSSSNSATSVEVSSLDAKLVSPERLAQRRDKFQNPQDALNEQKLEKRALRFGSSIASGTNTNELFNAEKLAARANRFGTNAPAAPAAAEEASPKPVLDKGSLALAQHLNTTLDEAISAKHAAAKKHKKPILPNKRAQNNNQNNNQNNTPRKSNKNNNKNNNNTNNTTPTAKKQGGNRRVSGASSPANSLRPGVKNFKRRARAL